MKNLLFALSLFSTVTQAATIDSSELTHVSDTGVFRSTLGSFADLVSFETPFFGVGFERVAGANPSITWNIENAFDITGFYTHGQFGRNAQGAVNKVQVDFYERNGGGGALLGSYTTSTFSTNQTILWDISSLNIQSPFSVVLTMLGRDEITASSIPGQWYEMGYFGLYEGKISAVPVPTAAWLMAPALIGFVGLRRQKVK
jgi:hypothetical protein